MSTENLSVYPKKSQLEMTADDYMRIGSTAPEILQANPGKTKGNLMTDEEIRVYLHGHEDLIQKLSTEEYASDRFAQSVLIDFQDDLALSKSYLTKIDRLPEEYKESE